MKWMLSGLVAALVVAAIAVVMRRWGFNRWTYLACLSIYPLALWGYAYGYAAAPSFPSVWFYHTAINAAACGVLTLLIFHEKVEWFHIAGIAVVIAGVALLNWRAING